MVSIGGSFMKKSDTAWVLLTLAGLVLILLAGFYTGVPTLLDYLDYVFLAAGVVAFILAALKFRRRNFSTE
jgi:hypothetical protein